jgi:hypothetical protein
MNDKNYLCICVCTHGLRLVFEINAIIQDKCVRFFSYLHVEPLQKVSDFLFDK